MGKTRKFSPHKKWNKHEMDILNNHYVDSPHEELLALLPGRTISQIQNKAYLMGLRRLAVSKMSNEERLKRKREYQARKRLENPEEVKKYRRERHHKNLEKNKRKLREYYYKRFFWGKAMKLRSLGRASYIELAFLWKLQRGRCALTGQKLDRSAQLDHKNPRSKGGNDRIENLQWLTQTANLAKRDLTNDEFIGLCKLIVQHREK